MQKIEGTTIKVNRGDILNFTFSIKKEDGTNYTFQIGDTIRFAVYNKEGLNSGSLLLKEIVVDSESQSIEIELTSSETKIGNIVNKPIDYWYEIELNGEHTIIGYDDAGAKIFRLYPEGSKIE